MSRVSGKEYFLYILWSDSAQRFYTGISEDVDKRLRQHNEEPRGWTARHRPWRLVHVERFKDFRAARERENELKQQKGGHGFFKLTGLIKERFFPSGS